MDQLFSQHESLDLSEYQEAIFGYTAGYAARMVRTSVRCTECAASLLDIENSSSSVHEHPYVQIAMPPHFQLIAAKNWGRLLLQSTSVAQIIMASEKAFRVIVCQINLSGACQISGCSHVNKLLVVAINRSLTDADLFPSLRAHDTENSDIIYYGNFVLPS